jgi:hypothetical protein
MSNFFMEIRLIFTYLFILTILTEMFLFYSDSVINEIFYFIHTRIIMYLFPIMATDSEFFGRFRCSSWTRGCSIVPHIAHDDTYLQSECEL